MTAPTYTHVTAPTEKNLVVATRITPDDVNDIHFRCANHSTMVSHAATVKPNPSFETLKRENLFRNPPKDKTAFPALTAAVQPHVDSFNAVTEEGGLLDLARKEIGVKSVFDGQDGTSGNKISGTSPPPRNPRQLH